MNCPDNCPQLVKGKDSEGAYYQCCAKTIVIGFRTHNGFKTPLRGAVKLKIKGGKPAKREDCK